MFYTEDGRDIKEDKATKIAEMGIVCAHPPMMGPYEVKGIS